MKTKVVDIVSLREDMVTAIKNDKKKIKHGVVRYELSKDLSGKIICIDKDMFDNHTQGYINQGFYESKRLKVELEKIPCELVVMRNRDELKCFEQYDSLLSTYLKPGCELCYYEVIL